MCKRNIAKSLKKAYDIKVSIHLGVSPSGKAADSESAISLVRIQIPQPYTNLALFLIRLFLWIVCYDHDP